MVTMISGGANSNAEQQLISHIRQALEDDSSDIIVLLPDQFSFELDKRLYKALGPQAFNRITTAGIDRLSQTICAEYGRGSKDEADDNVQVILMFKALKRFSKEGVVRYYKRSLTKARFIGELLTLVSQLRESGITPEALRLAAERLEGSVSMKLFDLSSIYSLYLEEIDNAGMTDMLTRSAEAAELADSRSYFAGKTVFVTAFHDFTYDQLKLIEACIRDSRSFTISLLIDESRGSDLAASPFSLVLKTRQQIVDICRDHNKSISFENASGSYYRSDDIALLSRKLFDLRRPDRPKGSDDVRLLSADDAYEEADFICAEIVRLVRDEGYAFNDIAVALREVGGYAYVLESAFEKYDIPYFIDKSDSVDASAIVHYINALFNAVLTRSFKTEYLIRLMRSQLMGLMNYDVSDLEDYCIRWGVEGDMWLTDFTASPQEGVKLERINALRRSIIEPLLAFKESCQDATAAQISEAFYKLLDQVRLSEQTYSLVRRASSSDNETTLELARGLKQLWTMSLSAVGAIYETIGDEKITLRRYYELYSIMLSRQKISVPPQKLDCVRVIDAGRSRFDNVKVVFAAEVNEGVFPGKISSPGLVTEHEKELLRVKEDILIQHNAMRDFRAERLAAYSALCAPTDKLYVLYSMSDLLGNERRPSMLVKEIREILGVQEELISQMPLEHFCTSYKTAYSVYIEHSRDRSPQVRSIYESMLDNDHYHSRLRELSLIDPDKPLSLGKETSEALFFGSDVIKASPTKLDNYFKCPFMYFCSYGLRLSQEKKMDIDGLNKGLLVHSVLEKTVISRQGTPSENKAAFLAMTQEEIDRIIDQCFEEYYNDVFCGDFGKTSSFEYNFRKLRAEVTNIVAFVRQELEHSGFAPAVAEYKVDHREDGDYLDLELSDGRRIVLIGTIDRADIYENENGERFVRIVDYKYRKTIKFSLADLYCGLDLQMLIYLSLLLETDNELDPDHTLKQAGVFYFKLYGNDLKLRDDCELSEEELYKAACESAVQAFSRDGRISDLDGVDQALDETLSSRKLAGITLPDRLFTAMREFAKQKVVEYGDRLMEGDIDADPLEGTCTYCLYQGICGRAFPDEPRKGSIELMKERLEQIAEEMENGGEDQ